MKTCHRSLEAGEGPFPLGLPEASKKRLSHADPGIQAGTWGEKGVCGRQGYGHRCAGGTTGALVGLGSGVYLGMAGEQLGEVSRGQNSRAPAQRSAVTLM